MLSHSQPSGQRPPSPARLKRTAASLRVAQPDLSQIAALDIAAQGVGWPTFKAYLKAWGADRENPPFIPRFEVVLSASWYDFRIRRGGTEIAKVSLSAPWWEFLTLEQRRAVTAVSRFRIDRRDRSKLVSPHDFNTSVNALHYVRKAARALAFVDVLRVLPARGRALHEGLGISEDSRFPALDHEVGWHDPTTGAYFLTNEPYRDALARQANAQKTWFDEHGLSVIALPNGSLHNPPDTVLQFILPANQAATAVRLQRRFGRLQEALAAIT